MTARYVIHPDIQSYEQLGWMLISYIAHRGEYPVYLMGWPCECRVVEPRI